jgi:hypothetical protein
MATNAFQAGFNRKQNDDDDGSQQQGASGAFQSGFAAGQNKNQNRKAKSTLKKAKGSSTSGLDTVKQAISALIPSYKHGGRVKKTGLAFLHRGEHVVPVGAKTRIVSSLAREPLSPAKHGRRKQVTKIVGSPVAKR